ncbi:MAG TPA: hypothetical protein VEV65_01150 [Kineosporiaceae bacterium]|nr:hypothetical protein [Kineosporiaceae bacterium]
MIRVVVLVVLALLVLRLVVSAVRDRRDPRGRSSGDARGPRT